MVFYSIDYAPCPPFFVDDVYNIFITTAKESGLNDSDIEYIRVKCSIEIPTTTTTTTTTTTAPTTTTERKTTLSPTTKTSSEETTTTQSSSSLPVTTNVSKSSDQSTVSTNVISDVTSQSNNISDVTSQSNKTIIHTDFTTPFSTNVTDNVTMAAGIPRHLSGCGQMCSIGIATSAACFGILILSLIGIAILFRKGRDRRHRSTSRNRSSRFADMPNTDFYDSVDIEDSSSKRNSGSFLRRSGDYSKAPLTFDNPGYRRSLELRPQRYNSWYDPDATDFEYSQTNAYLVPSKTKICERRSMSASRLNDKHSGENGGRGSSRSLHSYVPKVCLTSDGRHEPNGYTWGYKTTHLPNGVRGHSPVRGALPRTTMEPNYEKKSKQDVKPRFKPSHRSRSFDPDYNLDRARDPDPQYHTVDKRHSKYKSSRDYHDDRERDHMSGHVGGHVGGHVSRREKGKKINQRRHRDNNSDLIDMSNFSNNPLNNYHYADDHTIISSNLHPSVSIIYKGPAQQVGQIRTGSKSYREKGYSNNDNRNLQNMRSNSYKPSSHDSNIHMYQTKL